LIRRIRNFNDFIVDVVDEDVYEDTDDDWADKHNNINLHVRKNECYM
jgi:hypothetical protein